MNISRHPFVDSNTRNRQQWYPRDVLELCRDGRCVGYAPSKRRKCQICIASWSVSTMNAIIDEMSRQLPDPTILRPQLQRLATYGLCVRYHQGQVDSMVYKWSRKIYAAFPTGRVPVSDPSPSHTVASSISSATPPHLENLRDMRRCTNELLAIVSNNHPPIQTTSMTSTSVSEISSPALSRRSSIPSDSSEHTIISSTSDSTESTHQTITPPSSISQISRTATPSSAEDDATEPLTSLPSPPQPQPCARPHVRRILLSDPCPICHEGGPLSSCLATDIVWCKSSCGRPVHKSCFEIWRTQREQDGQTPTCVICRADWDDECDCQGCHHVPRRSGDTACAICLDALVMSSGAGSEAEEEGTVWCKDGCGQSVHKICFEIWREHCADAGRDATCVLCRATWNTDCSC